MAKACAGRRFFQRFLRFRRRRPSLSPTPCRHPTKEKPPLATMQKAERTENMTNRSERPKKGQQTLIAPIFYRERPFHGKTHSTNHTLPLIFSHAAGVVNICSRLFRRSPTPLFAPFGHAFLHLFTKNSFFALLLASARHIHSLSQG